MKGNIMLFKREKLSIKCVVLAMSVLMLSQAKIQASAPAQTSIVPVLASAAATVVLAGAIGIKYLRIPDKTMPTFDQLNAVTILPTGCKSNIMTGKELEKSKVLRTLRNKSGLITINGELYSVHKGIHPDLKYYAGPVSVYSGGYSNDGNPYAYCGYVAQKAGVIPGAVVTFEFPSDTRAGFNFCQEQDNACPRLACEEVVKVNPNAQIILHGACKGGMNNLKFLAAVEQKLKRANAQEIQDNPELSKLSRLVHHNIKAVVTESPPRSAFEGIKNQPGGSTTTPILMRAFFPNYDHKAKTIMNAQDFPGTSMFLASLPDDSISVLGDMKEMVCHLNKVRKDKSNESMDRPSSPIQHFESKEATIRHGQIGKAKDYQTAVRAFYRERNLLPAEVPVASQDSR